MRYWLRKLPAANPRRWGATQILLSLCAPQCPGATSAASCVLQHQRHSPRLKTCGRQFQTQDAVDKNQDSRWTITSCVKRLQGNANRSAAQSKHSAGSKAAITNRDKFVSPVCLNWRSSVPACLPGPTRPPYWPAIECAGGQRNGRLHD